MKIIIKGVLNKIRQLKKTYYDLKDEHEFNLYCNELHYATLEGDISKTDKFKMISDGLIISIVLWNKNHILITDSKENKLKMEHYDILV